MSVLYPPQAFADFDKTLGPIDVLIHTNSVSVGVDPTVSFLKQLGETSKSGGSIQEFYQGLGRVGRCGNLKCMDVDVVVDRRAGGFELHTETKGTDGKATTTKWHKRQDRYTFAKCWDTVQKCIRKARGQLSDFKKHKVMVPHKMNVMPEYAQKMIAWSSLARKETEFNHTSEFVRYALAHHFRLTDSRNKRKRDGEVRVASVLCLRVVCLCTCP